MTRSVAFVRAAAASSQRLFERVRDDAGTAENENAGGGVRPGAEIARARVGRLAATPLSGKVFRHVPGATRDVILYLALSGGRGQFIDLIYVLISRRLFRRPIFVHHHSFVYINSPSWLNRCFFALVRNATHIALSPNMGQALRAGIRLEFGRDHRVVECGLLRLG